MQNLYYEEIHKAERDYPYIQLQNINFSYVAHYHKEIELIYVVSGEAVINIGGNDVILKEKDIYIVMPGEIHSISGTHNVIYIMKFYADHEFVFLKINGHITTNEKHYDVFKSIIDNIAVEDTAKKPGYKYAVNMHANRLMLEIIRTLDPVRISEHLREEGMKKMEFLNAVNKYLEENYSNDISVESFASSVGYSKYYFAHMFKDITRQSCAEFITCFRLKKAKELIMNGAAITETAYACGFNNLRSFNRSFKKYYEITPREFRSKVEL